MTLLDLTKEELLSSQLTPKLHQYSDQVKHLQGKCGLIVDGETLSSILSSSKSSLLFTSVSFDSQLRSI